MSWIIRKTKRKKNTELRIRIQIRRISKKMRNKSAETVAVVVIDCCCCCWCYRLCCRLHCFCGISVNLRMRMGRNTFFSLPIAWIALKLQISWKQSNNCYVIDNVSIFAFSKYTHNIAMRSFYPFWDGKTYDSVRVKRGIWSLWQEESKFSYEELQSNKFTYVPVFCETAETDRLMSSRNCVRFYRRFSTLKNGTRAKRSEIWLTLKKKHRSKKVSSS